MTEKSKISYHLYKEKSATTSYSEKVFIILDMIPKWRDIKEALQREGKLSRIDALYIIRTATKIMRAEPNIMNLSDPVTVVGDLHGQFYDLLKVIDIGGNPESVKYLFLGDYVDRGVFSCEVILLLYSIKVMHLSDQFPIYYRANERKSRM